MAWTEPNKTWGTNEVVTAPLLNTYLRDQLSAVLPIGTIIMRVANYNANDEVSVEGRWLQCNGAAVSRTTYAALFNYFNSMSPALPFGSGDGVTTFNLPDFVGRVPVGHGAHASPGTLGNNDGVAKANRRPQHRHSNHTHGTSLATNGSPNAATGGGGGSVNRVLYSATADTAQIALNATGADGGSGNAADSLDAPAHLVFGSFFIKYTA